MFRNFNPQHGTQHDCLLSAVLTDHTCEIRRKKMGNISTACQMSNHSKRNVRVFITETAAEIDDFLVSQSDDDGSNEEKIHPVFPGGKKFTFKKDIDCVRVLASQTKEVPWAPEKFLSVYVEDEDDENICSKQIIQSMALSAPITVLLYDV